MNIELPGWGTLEIDFGSDGLSANEEATYLAALKSRGRKWSSRHECRLRLTPADRLRGVSEPQAAPEGSRGGDA